MMLAATLEDKAERSSRQDDLKPPKQFLRPLRHYSPNVESEFEVQPQNAKDIQMSAEAQSITNISVPTLSFASQWNC
jgi:hypothetical protein